MKKTFHSITGILEFSPKKIVLKGREDSYFVRGFSVRDGYVHGDLVKAKVVKRSDGSRLAEVEITGLICRTREMLIARKIQKKGSTYLKVIAEQGGLEVSLSNKPADYPTIPLSNYLTTLYHIRFDDQGIARVTGVFGDEGDYDIEERLILSLAGARIEFPGKVIEETENLQKSNQRTNEPPNQLAQRTDFRNWYTLTIDGADAKDLDDAISLKKLENGNILLAVHIADVAEYVREGNSIDREALARATSIYTPGKVIPMLPEALSNDLCSLHPGEPKLTLSCVMEMGGDGQVKKTDIVESIIESDHRGVYDDIWRYKNTLDENSITGVRGEDTVGVEMKGGLKDERSRERVWLLPETFGTFGHKSTELDSKDFRETILLAFELYETMKTRRQKEGKILFETTEMYFDFGKRADGQVLTPTDIRKRERNDTHKLIEEFMVLANEEVAKWCEKQNIPFLSRVHGLPGNDQSEIIRTIIGGFDEQKRLKSILEGKKQITSKSLEPIQIQEFLTGLKTEEELYRYSRLLLPKMAKATYSDKPFRHFGLALEYYAHFTSPIRRYPDLQIHRIIKEKLQGKLTKDRIKHYQSLLKKVATLSSEKERDAEDIERTMDDLYACRYMENTVGQKYPGRISGIAEFAYFVELENGVEVTIYVPRGRYIADPITGILSSQTGKKIAQIGERLEVVIEEVNMGERRIVGKKI